MPLRRFGRRVRLMRRCRHHVDDAIAPRLQLMQDPRQRGDRSGLDVVQQQDAFSLGFEPLHRELINARSGNRPPVVGRKICAPDLDTERRQIVLDGPGAPQARHPEERRKPTAIAKRCRNRGYPIVDLGPRALDGKFIEAQRMILGVGADAVTGVAEFADAFRIGSGHAADGEEGRLYALRRENSQNLIAVTRQRSVIERQHHLVIPQRQRFGVLHGTDPGMLPRIDHQDSRGAERIRIAGAIGARRS